MDTDTPQIIRRLILFLATLTTSATLYAQTCKPTGSPATCPTITGVTCSFPANVEKGCNCYDGIDNDNDGQKDGNDLDCASYLTTYVGTGSTCTIPPPTTGSAIFNGVTAKATSSQNTADTPSHAAIGDMNGDGVPDAVITSKWNSTIQVVATANVSKCTSPIAGICGSSACTFASNIEKGCNCYDGIDNDKDGKIDMADLECSSMGNWTAGDIMGDIRPNGDKMFDIYGSTHDYPFPAGVGPFSKTGSDYTFEHETAIADIDGDGIGEIYTIMSYRPGGPASLPTAYFLAGFRYASGKGNLIKLFTPQYLGADRPGSPGVADFDGDGKAEVYIRNQIYAAEQTSGTQDALSGLPVKLADGGGNWKTAINTSSVAVDIDGDGKLELVCGNFIYKMPAAGFSGRTLQTMTVYKDMNADFPTKKFYPKGYNDINEYGITQASSTSVADFDVDGYIDVFITGAVNCSGNEASPCGTNATTIFYWNVHNNTLQTYTPPDPVYPLGWVWGTGRINLYDAYPNHQGLEALFMAGKSLYCLDNSTFTTGTPLWVRNTPNDALSGILSITCYDFDNDGNIEVVYRDTQALTVADGKTGQTTIWSTTCQSHTMTEGPIIADVNGDGATDICVPCYTNTNAFDISNSTPQQQSLGQLQLYYTNSSTWLPTRKVWNQHPYFVVNINDNLTLPTSQISQSLIFGNGACPNGVQGPQRPLNLFMDQVPHLSASGCPEFPAPDITFYGDTPSSGCGAVGGGSPPAGCDTNGDGKYLPTVVITPPICGNLGISAYFNITNNGDLAITDNIPVSFFNGDPTKSPVTATKLFSASMTVTNLGIGGTFTSPTYNFNGPGNTFTLYVVIYNDGTSLPISLTGASTHECSISNNMYSTVISPSPFTVTTEVVQNNLNCPPYLVGNNGQLRSRIYIAGVEQTDYSPYAFQWYDASQNPISGATSYNLSNLDQGTYYVKVVNTQKGCSGTLIPGAITRANPAFPAFNFTNVSEQTICSPANGERIISAADGSVGYTYTWLDLALNPIGVTGADAKNLVAGTYSVQIQKGTCTCKDPVTGGPCAQTSVSGPAYPDASASKVADVVDCLNPNSGSVTSDALLGGVVQNTANYTFDWYFYNTATSTRGSILPAGNGTGHTRTGLAAGSYQVVITDNTTKCQATTTPFATVGTSTVTPTANITQVVGQTSCDPNQPNGILTATGTATGYTSPTDFKFEWFRGDNTLAANLIPIAGGPETVSGAKGETLNKAKGGGVIYTVKVTTPLNCSATFKLPLTETIIQPVVTLTQTPNDICDAAKTSPAILYDGTVTANVTFNGAAVTLPDPNYTINWYDGTTTTTAHNPATTTTATITGLQDGKYFTAVATRNDLHCTSNAPNIAVGKTWVQPVLSITPTGSNNCDPALTPDGTATANIITSPLPAGHTYTYQWYEIDPVSGVTIATLGAANNGTSVTAIKLGGPFSPAKAYMVDVIDRTNGCENTTSQSVSDVSVIPVLTTTTSPNSICSPATSFNGSMTATVTNIPAGYTIADYTFSWFDGNSTATPHAPASTAATLTKLDAGSYSVKGKNTKTGCVSSLSNDNVAPTKIFPALLPASTGSNNCDPALTPDGTASYSVTNTALSPGPFTQQWYVGSGDPIANGLTALGAANNGTLPTAIKLGGPNIPAGSAPHTYTVLVTNTVTGCTNFTPATVQDNSVIPTLTTTTTGNGVCDPALGFIGTMTATVTNIPALYTIADYSFKWYDGATTATLHATQPSPASTVTLTQLDSKTFSVVGTNTKTGCVSAIATNSVGNTKVYPSLLPATTGSNNCVADGTVVNGVTVKSDGTASVTASGTPGGYNYQWFTGTVDLSDYPAPNAHAGTIMAGKTALNLTGVGGPGGAQYTVYVADQGTGCSAFITASVPDNQNKPILTATPTPNDICSPAASLVGSVTASLFNAQAKGTFPNDYTFTWSVGAPVTGNPALTKLDAGTYTVTATNNQTGCVSPLASGQVLDQKANPSLTVSSTGSHNCSTAITPDGTAKVDVTAQGPGGADTFTYAWTPNGAAPAGTSGAPTNTLLSSTINNVGGPNAGSPGTPFAYGIKVTNNRTGCFTNGQAQVQDLSAKPTIALQPFDNSICVPSVANPYNGHVDKTSVTNNIAPGYAGATTFKYTWTDVTAPVVAPHPIATQTLTAATSYTQLTAGDYSGTVTIVELGCTSDPVFVNIKNVPIYPAFSVTPTPSTNCTGANNGSISATVSNAGVGDTFTFDWHKGDLVTDPLVGSTDLATSTSISSQKGLQDFTVQATNTKTGCAANFTQTLADNSIKPTFTLAITDNDKCVLPKDGQASIAGLTDPNAIVGDTYTIAFTSTVSGPQTGASVDYLSQPASFATATVKNDRLGCTSAPVTNEIKDVPVYPAITTSVVNSTNCAGGNPNGSATVTAPAVGVEYRWYLGSSVGVAGTEINGAAPGGTAGISSKTGTQDFTVQVTSTTSGCASSKTVTIQDQSQLPLITPLTVTPNHNCTGTSDGTAIVDAVTPFTYHGTTISSPYTGFTLTWSAGTVGPVDKITGLAAGSYTLKVTAGGANTITNNNDNCISNLATAVIIDNQTHPAIAMTIKDQTSCGGTPNGKLTASSAGGITYAWFDGIGTGGAAHAQTAANSGIIDLLAAGDYTVQVTDNTTGCASTQSPNVANNVVNPTVSFVGVNPVSKCNSPDGSATAAIVGLSAPTNYDIYYVYTSTLSGAAYPTDPAEIKPPPFDPANHTYTSLLAQGAAPVAYTGMMPGYLTALVVDKNTLCESTPVTQQIIDNTQKGNITVVTQASPGACGGGNGGMVPTVTAVPGPAPAYTYHWYVGTPTNATAPINFYTNPPTFNNVSRTGTITCGTGSAAVVGVGTKFLTELEVGSVIKNAGGTVIGTVFSITDNLNLTLTANAAVAVAGAAYKASEIYGDGRQILGINGGDATIGAGTYTLVVIDPDGCGTYHTDNVPTGNAPTIAINTTDITRCDTPNGQLDVQVTVGANANGYQINIYSGNDALTGTFLTQNQAAGPFPHAPTLPITTASGLSAGTYFIEVIDEDYPTCPMGSNRVLVNKVLPPIITINQIVANTSCDPNASADGKVNLTVTSDASDTQAKAYYLSNISPLPVGYATPFIPANKVGGTGLSPSTTGLITGFKPSKTQTGTITAGIASTAVVGVGTKFLTEVQVGSIIKDSNGTIIGTVAAIADDTHLTLAANAAVAVAGGSYVATSYLITVTDDNSKCATDVVVAVPDQIAVPNALSATPTAELDCAPSTGGSATAAIAVDPITEYNFEWYSDNALTTIVNDGIATPQAGGGATTGEVFNQSKAVPVAAWPMGATGLGSGDRTFYVRGKKNATAGTGIGCYTNVVQVTIPDQHATPAMTITSIANTSCDPAVGEGSISISTTTAGVAPISTSLYNYVLDPAGLNMLNTQPGALATIFTSVKDGTYLVRGTNVQSGCKTEQNHTVSPSKFSLAITGFTPQDKLICNPDGSITVTQLTTDRTLTGQPNVPYPGGGTIANNFDFRWFRTTGPTSFVDPSALVDSGPTVIGSAQLAAGGGAGQYPTMGAGLFYVIAKHKTGGAADLVGQGCTTPPIQVTINDKHVNPTVTLAPFSDTSCNIVGGFEGSIDATVTDASLIAGPFNYNYTWTSTSTTTPVGSPPTFTGALQTFANLQDGDYSLTALNNMTGCQTVANTTIVKNVTPVFVNNYTVTNQLICKPNGDITITGITYKDRFGATQTVTPAQLATDFTFAWTRPVVGAVGNTTALLDVAAYGSIGADIYTVKAKRTAGSPGNGCTSAPVNIEIQDKSIKPVPALVVLSDTSCDPAAPAEGEIQINVTDATPAPYAGGTYQYDWTGGLVPTAPPAGNVNPGTGNGDGINNGAGPDNDDYLQLLAGSYNLKITNNTTGCFAITAPTILKNSVPVFVQSVTATPQILCDLVNGDGSLTVSKVTVNERGGAVPTSKDYVVAPGAGQGNITDFTFDWSRALVVGHTQTTAGNALTTGTYNSAPPAAGFGIPIGADTYTVIATRTNGAPGHGCKSAPFTAVIKDERINPVVTPTPLSNTSCDNAAPEGEIKVKVTDANTTVHPALVPGGGFTFDYTWTTAPTAIAASAGNDGDGFGGGENDGVGIDNDKDHPKGLLDGSYVVKVTNPVTQCFTNAPAVVPLTQLPVIVESVVPIDAIICNPDGSLSVSAVTINTSSGPQSFTPATFVDFQFEWRRVGDATGLLVSNGNAVGPYTPPAGAVLDKTTYTQTNAGAGEAFALPFGPATYTVVTRRKSGSPGKNCFSTPYTVVLQDKSLKPVVSLTPFANTSCSGVFEGEIEVKVTDGTVNNSLNTFTTPFKYNYTNWTTTSTTTPPTSVLLPNGANNGDVNDGGAVGGNPDGDGDNPKSLQDGDYTVTVVNPQTGCSSTGSTTIYKNSTPVFTQLVTPTDQVLCTADGKLVVNSVKVIDRNGVTKVSGVDFNISDFVFTYDRGTVGTTVLGPSGATQLDNTNYGTIGFATYFVTATRNAGSPGAGCSAAPYKVDILDKRVFPAVSLTPLANTSCDPAFFEGEIKVKVTDASVNIPAPLTGTPFTYNYTWPTVVTTIANSVGNDGDGFGGGENDGAGIDNDKDHPIALQDGSYTVTVTNAVTGCSSNGNTTIFKNSTPVFTQLVVPTAQVLCKPDGTLVVKEIRIIDRNGVSQSNLNGDFPLSDFAFSYDRTTIGNNIIAKGSPLQPVVTLDNTTYPTIGFDTYYVTATRVNGFPGNDCSSTPYRVDIEDKRIYPTMKFASDANSSCNVAKPNGSVQATASEPNGSQVDPYTFAWTLNGTAVASVVPTPPTQTDVTPVSTLTNALDGAYIATVTNTNTGCSFAGSFNLLLDQTRSTPNIIDVVTVDPVDCNPTAGAQVTKITLGSTFNSSLQPPQIPPDNTVTGALLGPPRFVYTWYEGSITNPLAYTTLPCIGPGCVTPTIGLLSGDHFVTVKDSQTDCQSGPKEFTIKTDNIIYPVAAITQTVKQISCIPTIGTGELQATATETDGTTGTSYTFAWYPSLDLTGTAFGPPTAPSANNNPNLLQKLVVGNYSVQVKNNITSCTAQAFFIVPDDSPLFMPVLSVGTSPQTFCVGTDGDAQVRVILDPSYPLLPYDNTSFTTDLYTGATPNLANPPDVQANIPFTITGSPTTITYDVPGLATGFYTYRVTDKNTGCFSVDSVHIKLQQRKPVIAITEDNPMKNCDPVIADGQLSATADGKIQDYTFDWYKGTAASGSILQSDNKLIGQRAGQYTVRATVNLTGCFDDKTGTIDDATVIPPTPIAMTLHNQSNCVNPNGEVAATVGGITLGYSFQWYNGQYSDKAKLPSTVNYKFADYAGLNVGFYSVTATDDVTHCVSQPASTEVVDIRVTPAFKVDGTPSYCQDASPTGKGNGTFTLTSTAGAPYESINWSLAGDTTNVQWLGPYVAELLPGDYHVLVTSIEGCQHGENFSIITEIRPYNLVSTNNDGKNDAFIIDCISNYPSNNVKIFNRSGTMVYEANGYDNTTKYFRGVGEMGVYLNDRELPEGTYFYIIDKRNGTKPKSGFIELVR